MRHNKAVDRKKIVGHRLSGGVTSGARSQPAWAAHSSALVAQTTCGRYRRRRGQSATIQVLHVDHGASWRLALEAAILNRLPIAVMKVDGLMGEAIFVAKQWVTHLFELTGQCTYIHIVRCDAYLFEWNFYAHAAYYCHRLAVNGLCACSLLRHRPSLNGKENHLRCA